ncbi:hypothetical protein [Neisseria meningitidis]|uniref:hypothetical protein n=1 Tax=Neisseria meningitidis TaxID=487 RepID=UPI001C64CED7|nr:hypothetical protein [Neisseria meningitidis]
MPSFPRRREYPVIPAQAGILTRSVRKLIGYVKSKETVLPDTDAAGIYRKCSAQELIG